jgi:hypothetical protein
MSSATSTDALRPWQFFVIAALFAATAAVLMARQTSPAHLILISLAIGAAGLCGIAVYRMLAPLAAGDVAEAPVYGGRTRAALEREKALVLRSIKELEFDRAMGKVGDTDFEEMTARLRSRAIGLMRKLEGGATYREVIERDLRAQMGSEARPSAGACARCGMVNDPDAKFCKECGARVGAGAA